MAKRSEKAERDGWASGPIEATDQGLRMSEWNARRAAATGGGGDQAERMHVRHSTSEPEYDGWAKARFGPGPDGAALDPTTTGDANAGSPTPANV